MEGLHIGTGDTDAKVYGTTVPDVYAYIQNRVHLSRSSIFAILTAQGAWANCWSTHRHFWILPLRP